MKKVLILVVMMILMAGCSDALQQDENGNSPALETIGHLQAANAASAPVNPYAVFIATGLGIATVIAGGYGNAKRKAELRAINEKAVSDQKYEAHKRAVEKVIHDKSASVTGDDLYRMVGDERDKLGI